FCPPIPQYDLNIADTAHLILLVVKEASNACPISALRAVAGAVLVCLETVQASNRNKGLFERLAGDAFEVIYIIITQYHDTKTGEWKSMPQNLEDDLYRLLEKTLTIHEITSKRNKRKWHRRMLAHQQDADAIKDCRQALDHAKDVFQIRVSLSIHDTTLAIAKNQEDLLNEFREFREQYSAQPRETGSDQSTASPSPPSFPNIQSSSGTITVTTVSGDYSVNDSSNNVNNTNSGNTITTTVTNAYNDRSYRAGRRKNTTTKFYPS
ncbi:hypothetical protein BDQ17DRAFT_1341194, partial [Cyathus striatus]